MSTYFCMLAEKLHDMDISPHTITVIRAGQIRWACMWEMRNAYTILIANPVWKRLSVRGRHRWDDIIIINVTADVKWIQVAQYRVLNMVMEFSIPVPGQSKFIPPWHLMSAASNHRAKELWCTTRWSIFDFKSKLMTLLRISCTNGSTNQNMGGFRNSG
jgi:hypothetical protein